MENRELSYKECRAVLFLVFFTLTTLIVGTTFVRYHTNWCDRISWTPLANVCRGR